MDKSIAPASLRCALPITNAWHRITWRYGVMSRRLHSAATRTLRCCRLAMAFLLPLRTPFSAHLRRIIATLSPRLRALAAAALYARLSRAADAASSVATAA